MPTSPLSPARTPLHPSPPLACCTSAGFFACWWHGLLVLALSQGCMPSSASPPEAASSHPKPVLITPQPPALPESTTTLEASSDDFLATHRAGQTFLTWKESGSTPFWALYRERPGAVPDPAQPPLAVLERDACAAPRQASLPQSPQKRWILTPQGPELAPGWSCYVHTPHLSQEMRAVYWLFPLTQATATPALAQARRADVTERPGTPEPLLIQEAPGGRRKLFTQWVDDRLPRATSDGAAFNFWVGLPPGKAPATGWPLTIHLHAWGESWQRFYQSSSPESPGTPYDLPMAWLELDDPSNTWWTGAVARPLYQPQAAAQAMLHTETRVLAVMAWLLSPASGMPIDPERVTLYGGSMGGTGALALSLHHPNRFAAVYAQLPLIRPASSTWGRPGFQALFGNPLDPPRLANGKTLYEYLDLIQTLAEQQGGEGPFTVTLHGRTDQIIEWDTQGLPWLQAVARHGSPGPALFAEGDHSSVFDSFTAKLIPNFRPSEGHFRRHEPYPVFSNFSGDDDPAAPLPTCRHPDRLYRYGFVGGGIRWSGQGVSLLGLDQPEETPTTLRVGLQIRTDVCNLPQEGTTDITLHRLQQLQVSPEKRIGWETFDTRGQRRSNGVGRLVQGRIRLEKVPVTQEGVLLSVWSR